MFKSQNSIFNSNVENSKLEFKCQFRLFNSAFSLTWPASMQIYWNKRKRFHKKRFQLSQDCLGQAPIWPSFHCFGTPIWPPWRHVKTLYWCHWYENDYLFSCLGGGEGGGTPGNTWWGCAVPFSKSWPHFRPKHEIFHTRFQTRPLKSIPVFRPGTNNSETIDTV